MTNDYITRVTKVTWIPSYTISPSSNCTAECILEN